jgi:sec-independent protein translocase protein TatA
MLIGFLPTLGATEIIVLLVIGVFLFGRKLPEVGRYLGKGIVEFKKGMSGIEDHVEGSVPKQEIAPEPIRPPQRITPSVPKFSDAEGGQNAPKV